MHGHSLCFVNPTQSTISLPEATDDTSNPIAVPTPSTVPLGPGPPVAADSPQWKSRKRYAPVTFTPPVRTTRDRVRLMVWGYPFDPDYLDAYCAQHDIRPKPEDPEMRDTAHINAMLNIMRVARLNHIAVFLCAFTGKYYASGNAELVHSLALGCNKDAKLVRGPGEEVIRRVQSVMGLTTPPVWHELA